MSLTLEQFALAVGDRVVAWEKDVELDLDTAYETLEKIADDWGKFQETPATCELVEEGAIGTSRLGGAADPDSVRIAWIDVETVALDPADGPLLEVACVITDGGFAEVAEPFHAVIYQHVLVTRELRLAADPVVRDMHDRTGLWAKLPGGTPLRDVDRGLVAYLEEHVPEGEFGRPWLGGNSITLDRNFLETYLPEGYERLHYRSVDMTGVAEFLRLTAGLPAREKRRTRGALEDVRESLDEARHYAAWVERLAWFAEGLEW